MSVCNWDDWEKLMHHGFYNELRAAPEEHLVVMAEPPCAEKVQREKITQIMFETFNTPALLLVPASVLSCYATGRSGGLVLLGGHMATYAAPVYAGHEVSHAVATSVYGGLDVLSKFTEMLAQDGISLTTTAEREIAEDILLKHGHVLPGRGAINTEQDVQYELPDGQIITCQRDSLWKAPETIFDGSDDCDLGDLVKESIDAVDKDLRKMLLGNVVLSGGGTCFPGFPERVESDLRGRYTGVKVVAPPERKYLAWIGGSIMASFSSSYSMAVSKEEYDEMGPRVAGLKFI